MIQVKNFYKCKKCGKIIIERRTDGLFHFVFGKSGKSGKRPPVEIIIHGNVKMRCLRRNCDTWNTFNFLPENWEEANNPKQSD